MLKNGAEANILVASEANVPLLLFALGWRNSVNMRIIGAAQVLASNSKPIVSLLLQAGADVHASAPDGCTALMAAICLGWEDLTTQLLQWGADVNTQQTPSGVTALMLAISSSNASVTQLLLDYGAEIDSQDRYGMTALIMAVRQKKTVIQMLLQRGADAELTCSNGVDTAFSFARLGQDTDIMKQLLQANAKK